MVWVIIYAKEGVGFVIASPFSTEEDAVNQAKAVAKEYEVITEVANITKAIHPTGKIIDE